MKYDSVRESQETGSTMNTFPPPTTTRPNRGHQMIGAAILGTVVGIFWSVGTPSDDSNDTPPNEPAALAETNADVTLGSLTMQMAWDGITSVDQRNICEGVDTF